MQGLAPPEHEDMLEDLDNEGCSLDISTEDSASRKIIKALMTLFYLTKLICIY